MTAFNKRPSSETMPATVNSLFRSFAQPLLDFLYPPCCLSCNELLPDGQKHICERCWNSIERITVTHPLYQETRNKLLRTGFVSDLVSSFVFEKEGVFQHIAHEVKYNGIQSLGRELGRRLGWIVQEWQIEADYIIPIPLHKRKLRERGYNQAEAIARGMGEIIGARVRSDIIRRRRFTQSQTTLSLEERKKNMEGAFEIIPTRLSGLERKSCILVDDVITTGATLASCAQELHGAGAASVIAASAALAQ